MAQIETQEVFTVAINDVEAAVREFEEYLIGKDPMMIEHHMQALYRGGFYRGGGYARDACAAQSLWH